MWKNQLLTLNVQYMKKLLFVIPFIICMYIFYWCIPSDRYISTLYDIEAQFNQSPIKAWEELQQIPLNKLNRKESALYNLLLTKGQIAKDSLDLSDSLINIAIAYYYKIKDSTRLSQAYYYKGNIFRQKKYYIQAIECYQNAESYATDKNIETKYFLNEIMGKIYHFKMMYEDEKEAKAGAVHFAQLLKDSLLIGQSLIQMAIYHNATDNFNYSINELKRAIQMIPVSYHKELTSANAELSRNYLSCNKADSSLYYINIAIQMENDSVTLYDYYNLKADAFLKLAQNDSAEYYFRRSLESRNLLTKVTTFYDLALLNGQRGNKDEELKYLKSHIKYRDSLDLNRKEGFIDHLQNIRAYKRQKENSQRIEQELIHNKVIFYRILTATFIVIFTLLFLFFRAQKRKRMLELNIKIEEEKCVRAMLIQKGTENKLLMEQEEREKTEIQHLNLTIEYYKRLNAMTIPILLKSQNKQGAMHLQEEEWKIIMENTDACFNGFTSRIKSECPQLTEEDVQFCCLIKMELSISLLSEIYHIAKTSISRKKVRLKEKMGIEAVTIDEFIRNF